METRIKIKTIFYLIFLLGIGLCSAEGPRYSHEEATQSLEFDNVYKDIRSNTAFVNKFIGIRSVGGASYNFSGAQIAENTTVNSSTVTVSLGSIKVFTIQLANGDGALCYTNYLSGTITVLGSAGNISNTTTPSSSNIGVNKSASSHSINFVTGSAASGTFSKWSVCFLGNIPG